MVKVTKSSALNLIGLALIVLLGLSLIGAIRANYELQKQIDQLGQQITSLNNDKEQLTYEAQYDQTDAYKEEQARLQLGLANPGENVIILPPTTKPLSIGATKPIAPKQKPKSNFQQWLDFLAGNY